MSFKWSEIHSIYLAEGFRDKLIVDVNRWDQNADGQTTYTNERMAKILGTSRPEMIGQPSFDYVFPTDVEAAQLLFDVKKDGNANTFRFRLRKKDDTVLWVEVRGNSDAQHIGRIHWNRRYIQCSVMNHTSVTSDCRGRTAALLLKCPHHTHNQLVHRFPSLRIQRSATDIAYRQPLSPF